MPSCFSLTYKSTGERAILQKVDEELCQFLGVPVSEDSWVQNWYNTIGLSLAIGHSLERTKEFFPEKEAIIDYLNDHFETNSWKEWK